MAEALLAHRLAVVGATTSVRSAGLRGVGDHPPAEVISTMAAYGIDVAEHRSTELRTEAIADASLILGMEREHVRRAVVAVPEVWPRAFTLKELIRRGQKQGPRPPGESLTHWLDRIHEGRDRWGLLGAAAADDIADPIGGPLAAYTTLAAEIAGLLDRLVTLSGGLCCLPVEC